ncbi:MAG: AmmeMemoRadiSam system radical SAM enzyme [Syntrophobacteraceae bacterium]
MKEAMLYRKLDDGKVHCQLCSQHCRIDPGNRGKCGVRENQGGILQSLVYGRIIARNIDPIEKKPLFHFHPGSTSYSIATMGCNFRCLFCQNSDISQTPREQGIVLGQETPPEAVVAGALGSGCASISYTYTEPTIFMEYALDVARRAKEKGIANVFVSNGYMTGEALDAAAPFLDAANVDLKAFTDKFYEDQCGAHLKPVMRTIEKMKRLGIWLEVTTLLIPGLNDDPGELRSLADFLVSVGLDIPWHVSRFHPTYRLTNRPPTPVESVRKACEIGKDAGLRYVYVGNVPGEKGENTYCHECGSALIERYGYSVRTSGLRRGACTQCGAVMAGVGITEAG